MMRQTPLALFALLVVATTVFAQTVIHIYPDPIHTPAPGSDPGNGPGNASPAFRGFPEIRTLTLIPSSAVPQDGAPVTIDLTTLTSAAPHAWHLTQTNDAGVETTQIVYTTRLTFGRAQTQVIYVDTEYHNLLPQLADAGWGQPLTTPIQRWTVPSSDAPTP